MNVTDQTTTRAYRFLLLTLGLAYVAGLPAAAASHGLLPDWIPITGLQVILLISPGPMAIFLIGRKEGWRAVRAACLSWSRPRLPCRWWAVLFGLPVAINVGALALHVIGGGALPELPASLPPEYQAVPALMLPVLLIFLSFAEELGWRGYALPLLQRRFSALTASLILGVVWALWHLPLSLAAESTQGEMAFGFYVVQAVAMSVIFTWFYNSTGGSLTGVTLLHASSQATHLLLPVFPGTVGTDSAYQVSVALTVAIGLVLILRHGRSSLAPSGQMGESLNGCSVGQVDAGEKVASTAGNPRGR